MGSQKLKAFISYSHADEARKDELIKFMKMLQRNDILESWNDRQLLAGEKLDAEILKNLNEADITILLISQDFISSYYCYEVELQHALSMESENDKRVVAIILDHCTWKQTPIKDYVLLPRDATPITDYPNPNKAWLEISEALEEVCKFIKKKQPPQELIEAPIGNNLLTEVFMDYLDSNEIVLHHRYKEVVSLSDIFIIPDLRILDEEVDKFDRIISSIKIKSPSSCPKKCMIIGEEQSGKTSFAKDIFKSFFDKGKYPIYIKGGDIKSGSVDEIIKESKSGQYNSPPGRFDLIIVEEVEQAKLNAKFLPALIKDFLERAETVIFISGSEIRYNESIWKELSEVPEYELLPFGHVLRGELINKWNSLGQELTIDLRELHAANDRVTHHIDSLLRKNIVPPKPIFILMILQTLESNSPSDFSLTAYGHCYNALIQQSLKKAKIKNEDIDKYINYLTELAYYIYSNKKTTLSDDDLSRFKANYSERYLIDSHDKVIQDICLSGLLRNNYSGLAFSYKYIYYFYAAKYIAENYELADDSDISELCKKIHSEKHANILIFVTYHTKDQKILDEILSLTERIFPEETPATLNPSDTEHFEEVVNAIPALVMENKTAQDIEESRKSKLDQKDRFEKLQQAEDDEEEELVEAGTLADINRSAKAVEIIGQILRNRYGSLKKSQLTDLTQSAFNSGLKFLSFYFKITKSQKKEIINAITKIIKRNSSLTDNEVKDEARRFFLHICYGVSFSVIRKISFSVGNDHLIPIFKKIAEDLDTPAGYLISLCIQLEFTKQINKDSLLLATRKISPGTMAYRLLQEVVIQHLYLHNVSFDERQWISSKLSIPVRDQRYFQGQKKTKILH